MDSERYKNLIINAYEKQLLFNMKENYKNRLKINVLNLEFPDQIMNSIKNYPEPFVINFFFYQFCFINMQENELKKGKSYYGCFEKSDIGSINNCISFFNDYNLEHNIVIEFLIQLRRYYERCIEDFKKINSRFYVDIKPFKEKLNFKGDTVVSLSESFPISCKIELILNYRLNNKKFLKKNELKRFIEKRFHEIEDNLYYVKNFLKNNEFNVHVANTHNKKNFSNNLYLVNPRIKWKGYDSDLYYLIKLISKKQPILEKELIQLIHYNFKDKNNNLFEKKNIRQGLNNLLNNTKSKNKSKNGKIIDEIFNSAINEITIDYKKLTAGLISSLFISENQKDEFLLVCSKLH